RIRTLPITVIAGRTPTPGSLTEVSVTEGYLRRVGLTRATAAKAVGTEVEIGAPRFFPSGAGRVDVRGRWTRAEIVGVVAQQAIDAQFLGSREMVRAARTWTAQSDPNSGFALPSSRYAGLFVVANGLDRVGSVRASITRLGYSTSSPENLIETVRRYLRVVEIVLAGIGLIALAIAALGITNALLAAVRERRREIGVLKAIGARDRDVRRIFLIEAGITGLVGGVLGTMAGYGIARVLGAVVNQYLVDQGLPGVGIGLPALVLVGGILGSAVLAVLAGVTPAQRAARLPARQAMGDA
ncbi:MAG: ABC transporter permease, partial [Acidimicrobiia bacterium]